MDVNNTSEYLLCLTRSWEDEETLSNIDGALVSKYNDELTWGGQVLIKVEKFDDVILDMSSNKDIDVPSIKWALHFQHLARPY